MTAVNHCGASVTPTETDQPAFGPPRGGWSASIRRLVSPHPRFVLREEHLPDEVAAAAHARLLEDALGGAAGGGSFDGGAVPR